MNFFTFVFIFNVIVADIFRKLLPTFIIHEDYVSVDLLLFEFYDNITIISE